jgi:V/A-type H+-transporting ATPase subunit C
MHYNLQPEVLFNYTIPHGYEFSLKDIKELCYVNDHDEFERRILKSRYSFLFDNEKTKDIFMERRSLRYQFFQIKNLRHKHEMNISEAIAFDVLLEYEIRDIVTVIECIRYGIPEDEAKRFLIRKL